MTYLAKEKIIVALDAPNSEAALRMLDQLGDSVSWVKIGLQLFISEGPSIVQTVKDRGYKVFLDLKIHDIPNTVREAVGSALKLGVDMTTIHLSGGSNMVRAAVEATKESPLLILGVTVLTSMNEADLRATGVDRTPAQQVKSLVELAFPCGLRGVVCSPHEIVSLREAFGSTLTIVTPGVRPMGAALGDQQRVMTPSEAVLAGANHLVIGRPITGAASPREAALAIAAEIETAL